MDPVRFRPPHSSGVARVVRDSGRVVVLTETGMSLGTLVGKSVARAGEESREDVGPGSGRSTCYRNDPY